MRGFKNNFERSGFLLGRCGQDAVVALLDDSIVRLEIIDAPVEIPGKDLPGLYQRRLQNVARKLVTLDESVEALAGVVAVKGDDAVEIELAKLALQRSGPPFPSSRSKTGDSNPARCGSSGNLPRSPRN